MYEAQYSIAYLLVCVSMTNKEWKFLASTVCSMYKCTAKPLSWGHGISTCASLLVHPWIPLSTITLRNWHEFPFHSTSVKLLFLFSSSLSSHGRGQPERHLLIKCLYSKITGCVVWQWLWLFLLYLGRGNLNTPMNNIVCLSFLFIVIVVCPQTCVFL